MTNPTNQPGDPYHPGQPWGDRSNPQDAGGYAQPVGYPQPAGYPQPGGYGYANTTGGQYPQYAAQPQPQPTYPPNVTGPWASYPQQPEPAKSGRPHTLSAAAALSLLTGSTLGLLGTWLLAASVVVGASRSALGGSLGSLASSGISSREVAFALFISVLLLGTAVVLLWGAIDTALARGTGLAIAGNLVAVILVLVVVVQSSAWLLVLVILPAIAVVLLMQPTVRNYVANRPRTD
ncbi:MAG: hypothetical protein ABWZ98_17265 [Nakamurella sp.]